jgi:2-polyprenyl-3-methyl-5-hydroxy-6-metoxy-1,4-benzoquinol methylase
MQTTSTRLRRGYSAAKAEHRIEKTRKIQALLEGVCQIEGARILEVGTSAGYIAAYIARNVGADGHVQAVDVVDNRKVQEGRQFQLVEDTTLTYEHAIFDISICSHALEHVGNRVDQLHHLREIRRILRPNAWPFLAAPNRYTLIEPHLRLPFVSCLPRTLGDRYVRATGKGDRDDCNLPIHWEALSALLRQAQFDAKDVRVTGITLVAVLKYKPGLQQQQLRHTKLWAWIARVILPTYPHPFPTATNILTAP